MAFGSSRGFRGADMIYRDAYHVIYRRGPFYVIYDVYTHASRFYSQLRDVVRALNRGV